MNSMQIDLMVLRAIDAGDILFSKLDLLDMDEIITKLDEFVEKQYIRVKWNEGHRTYDDMKILPKGHSYLKRLENKVAEASSNETEISVEVELIKGGKPVIDEQALRSHFKPIFLGEIRDYRDKMPDLLNVISNSKTDINVGRLALQIYKSKYFINNKYHNFTSWYKEFCRIIGRPYNKSYNKNRFETNDQMYLATVSFLHI